HKYLNFSNQSERFEIWKNSEEVFLKSPIIGHGTGDYKDVLFEQYKQNNYTNGISNKFNSHNQYLDTSLQLGLAGLIILIVFLYRKILNSSKENFEKKYIFIIFVISLITESMFDRHWGIVSIVLFTGFVNKYNILEN